MLIRDYMKESKQSELSVSVKPNFKPVEFDGTRLDKKNRYSIHFKTKKERDEAFALMKKEGIKCKKSY